MKYEFEKIEDFVKKAEELEIRNIAIKALYDQSEIAGSLRVSANLLLTACKEDENTTYLFLSEHIGHEDIVSGKPLNTLPKQVDNYISETRDKIKKVYGKAQIFGGRILE